MALGPRGERPQRSPARRRLLRRWRAGLATAERGALPLLLLVIAGIGLGAGYAGPATVPPGTILLPLLVGGFVLRRAATRLLIGASAIMLAFDVAKVGMSAVRPGVIVAMGVAVVIADWLAGTRERVGVPGLRGEAMLLELRDTLRRHGELPRLPGGWGVDVALESAGGASFGGDFLVASATGGRLELALVDVSGKGLDAGTRALLLSGAFGGLLGAVSPNRFLAEANRYLVRQEWDEGFATAVHLVVDLELGDFRIETAGHPPVVHFDAGSGRWHTSTATGVALGLSDEPVYDVELGRLRHGDALLVYTDGVVEVRGRELSVGIDKLVGEAERLVTRTFEGGAGRLLDAMRSSASDDRALVLLWRR
jgi:hypothetical protein